MPERTDMFGGRRLAILAAAPAYALVAYLHRRRRRGATMHRLESELRGDVVILRPYLGVHGGALLEIFEKLIDAGRVAIVVDLRFADRMDASGLAALVGGLRIAREADGDLRVCGANGQPLEIMKLTNVDIALPNYGSIEEAMNGLGEPA